MAAAQHKLTREVPVPCRCRLCTASAAASAAARAALMTEAWEGPLGAVRLLALPSWFTADPSMMAQGLSASLHWLANITVAQDSDLQAQGTVLRSSCMLVLSAQGCSESCLQAALARPQQCRCGQCDIRLSVRGRKPTHFAV